MKNRQESQDHGATKTGIFRFADFPHFALSDLLQYSIMGDSLPFHDPPSATAETLLQPILRPVEGDRNQKLAGHVGPVDGLPSLLSNGVP
jgi:hypothetical protein